MSIADEDVMDLVIVGAGAAGLMSAIAAARAAREIGDGTNGLRIAAVDSARTLGAKILVAGGGRCNVTHDEVDERAYAGSSANAIRKVLRGFDVKRTVDFFRGLGVELKREETGKLFPVTDSARTVLGALLGECGRLGVELVHPWKVERVEKDGSSGLFTIVPGEVGAGVSGRWRGEVRSRNVILATGGKSLPKSGSDGHGYEIARGLGHRVTERVFPALAPLVLDGSKTFLTELSGVSVEAELVLKSSSGKKLKAFTNWVLMTHFGISGPGALDMSRYFTAARFEDAGSRLEMNLAPGRTFEEVDAVLRGDGSEGGGGVGKRLTEEFGLAERMSRGLCEHVGVNPGVGLRVLTREARRRLAHGLTSLELPVVGDRGFGHAEVTAGGVVLGEVNLGTMESRVTAGLGLCGEICDVDGRIGGFNFQWAWSSGHVAGTSAAKRLMAGRDASDPT